MPSPKAVLRQIAAVAEDAVLLLFGVLLIPVAILLVGGPVAILVRLLADAIARW